MWVRKERKWSRGRKGRAEGQDVAERQKKGKAGTKRQIGYTGRGRRGTDGRKAKEEDGSWLPELSPSPRTSRQANRASRAASSRTDSRTSSWVLLPRMSTPPFLKPT